MERYNVDHSMQPKDMKSDKNQCFVCLNSVKDFKKI